MLGYQGKVGKHVVWDSMPLKGLVKTTNVEKKSLPSIKNKWLWLLNEIYSNSNLFYYYESRKTVSTKSISAKIKLPENYHGDIKTKKKLSELYLEKLS